MPESTPFTTAYGRERAGARAISTTQLLGQVLFLVAIALGFCALGTWLGRDLALGTARIISFVGFGMLLVSSFAGERFRVGSFAMGWLFATATAIGLGLGPVIQYFATVQSDALSQAAAGTAATVAGCGALGFALSPDLARWMRPLSLVVAQQHRGHPARPKACEDLVTLGHVSGVPVRAEPERGPSVQVQPSRGS